MPQWLLKLVQFDVLNLRSCSSLVTPTAFKPLNSIWSGATASEFAAIVYCFVCNNACCLLSFCCVICGKCEMSATLAQHCTSTGAVLLLQ